MIQVLDGEGVQHDAALIPLIRERAAEAGIKVLGDVIVLPVRGPRQRKVTLFGWESLAAWVGEHVTIARSQQPNLSEVLDGRRVGIPTLCRDIACQLAVGLVCPGEVSWRNFRL